jgi:hypothetical protein
MAVSVSTGEYGGSSVPASAVERFRRSVIEVSLLRRLCLGVIGARFLSLLLADATPSLYTRTTIT